MNTAKELTKSEYERLLMTAKNKKDRRLYYLMQTMAGTGLRVSEAAICYGRGGKQRAGNHLLQGKNTAGVFA